VSLKTNRRIDRVSGAEEFDGAMVSSWNSKRTALQSFMAVCESLRVRHVLISYNNESILPIKVLCDSLKERFGDDAVSIEEIQYKRNIMSQIGNAVLYKDTFKTENTEYLIWVRKA
jgi:adenine-specific DNA methylase